MKQKFKVSLCDKYLRKEFKDNVTYLVGLIGFGFIFITVSEEYRNLFAIIYIITLVIYYLYIWYNANNLKQIILNINETKIIIEEGDIFKCQGFKVISFNEFFDTQVDNKIISDTSLHGMYINNKYKDVKELDSKIINDSHLSNCMISGKELPRKEGKKIRYRLGSICVDTDFFLVAFSRFDKNNKAFLEMNDYFNCLLNFWKECDIFYSGKDINLPLLGSGITRFPNNNELTNQELLELLILTFRLSKIRFKNNSKIKIILTEKVIKEINLHKIKYIFN